MNRRFLLPLLTGVFLALSIGRPAWAAVDADKDQAGTAARQYLVELSDIVGRRVAGTGSEERGANYVSNTLKKIGYPVTFQKFTYVVI